MSINTNRPIDNSSKRKYDFESNETNKKSRIESSSALNQTSILHYTPIFDNIFNRLSSNEILAFEPTSKTSKKLTQYGWKHLKQTEHYFDWDACKNLPDKEKWNFFLKTAMSEYLKIISKSARNEDTLVEDWLISSKNRGRSFNNNIENFYKKIDGIIQKFPWFKDFVQTHLSFDSNKNSNDDKDNHVFTSTPLAGEILYDALIETNYFLADPSNTEKQEKVTSLYKEALKNGCTIASSFACLILKNTSSMEKELEQLAIGAAKQKDFQALEILTLEKSTSALKEIIDRNKSNPNNDYFLAPIFGALAEKSQQNEEFLEADINYTKALNGYDNQAPIHILLKAAECKMELDQFSEADKIFNQALSKYDDKILNNYVKHLEFSQSIELYNLFFKAAQCKIELDQFSEANKVLNQAQAIVNTKNFGEAELFNIAFLKAKMPIEQSEVDAEIAEICNQILSKYVGKEVPISVLVDIAYLKNMRSKPVEANEIFDSVLLKHRDQLSGEDLATAAQIKSTLNQFQEADKLYVQALAKYASENEEVSDDILLDVARAKLTLNQPQEVIKLCNQVLARYPSEEVPEWISEEIAEIKAKLQNS